jgi:hypothetical protein
LVYELQRISLVILLLLFSAIKYTALRGVLPPLGDTFRDLLPVNPHVWRGIDA